MTNSDFDDAHPSIDLAEAQRLYRTKGLMTQEIPEKVELVNPQPLNPKLKILKQELIKQFSDQPT
jgi:non-ribosomal peptide synthetase component E (peptide arylation enzyme)